MSEKKESDQQKSVKQEGGDSKDTAQDRSDDQEDTGKQYVLLAPYFALTILSQFFD